jgi:hypothetical protein
MFAKAKKIAESLVHANETAAVNSLQSRLKECEQAQILRERSLTQLPLLTVRACINNTKDLWPQYPLSLQVCIAFRFLEEPLREAAKALKLDTDKCNLARHIEGFDAFMQSICLEVDMLDTDGAAAQCFQGEKVTITDVLSSMWATCSKAENARPSLSSMNVDEALDADEKRLSAEEEAAAAAAEAGNS